MRLPASYDAWRLSGPEDPPEVGTEYGEACGRWFEPDEGCPKPWRCPGTMDCNEGYIECDTCREMPE